MTLLIPAVPLSLYNRVPQIIPHNPRPAWPSAYWSIQFRARRQEGASSPSQRWCCPETSCLAVRSLSRISESRCPLCRTFRRRSFRIREPILAAEMSCIGDGMRKSDRPIPACRRAESYRSPQAVLMPSTHLGRSSHCEGVRLCDSHSFLRSPFTSCGNISTTIRASSGRCSVREGEGYEMLEETMIEELRLLAADLSAKLSSAISRLKRHSRRHQALEQTCRRRWCRLWQ